MSAPDPTPRPIVPTRRVKDDSLLGGQLLLLFAACGAAILFAFLYITGDRSGGGSKEKSATRGQAAPAPAPAADIAVEEPPSLYPLGMEALNLEIQHVLVAESQDGSLEKILVEIPALFPTGTVQWDEAREERARALLERVVALRRYHSQLADENRRILAEWNSLMMEGQPVDVLRADSASLPTPAKTRKPTPEK